MKYLDRFNVKLRKFRDMKRLSVPDIAELCQVDSTVVDAWESDDQKGRCYPTLENMLDLCFKTDSSLENFIDFPKDHDRKQLELPGLAFIEEADLDTSLAQLDKEIERLVPADDEIELLRRYRRSDDQSKELILQLIAN